MDNTYSPIKSYLSSQGKDFSQENINALATSKGLTNFTSTDANNAKLSSMLNTPMDINANKAIPVSSLNTTVNPINLPTSPAMPLNSNVNASVNAPINPPIQNLATDALMQATEQDRIISQNGDRLSMSIASLIPELAGQGQSLADEQKRAGLDRFRQNLNSLNSEITIKSAEINQDDIKSMQSIQNIEDKPIAMDFIIGQQQSVQRNAQLARALKTAEIGMLNARVSVEQGNIQLAQDIAKQAVETKYAPIRESIEIMQQQLKAIEPFLKKAELRMAEDRRTKIEMAKTAMQDEKEQDKQVANLVINASSQGAPPGLVSQASKAKTPMQAAQILGQYSGDYLKSQLLKAQIQTEVAQKSKIYSDISKTKAEIGAINAKASGSYSVDANGNAVNISGKPLKVSNAEITDLSAAITGKNSIENIIKQYKDSITRTGTQVFYGVDAGERESLKTNLLLTMKNLEKTGALDKGSVDVLAGSIPSSQFFATEEGQIAKLDTLQKTVVGRTDEYINSYKGTTAEFDPRTKRAYEVDSYLDSSLNAVSTVNSQTSNSTQNYINSLTQ